MTNPINNMTDKETIVYRYALETCMIDYCVDVIDISNHCGMSVASARGVVGSLVKKGIIEAQENERNGETFHDLFASTPDNHSFIAFGNENLSDSQINKVRNYLQNIEEPNQVEVPEEVVVETKEPTVEEIKTSIEVVTGIINDFQEMLDVYTSLFETANDPNEYVVVIGDVLNHPVVEGGKLVHIGHGRTKDAPKFSKEEATQIGSKIENGNGLKGHAESWRFFLNRNIVKTQEHIDMMVEKLDEFRLKIK